MKIYPANNGIPEVIEWFIVFKVNVQAVFNSYLHLHWNHLGCSLHLLIGEKDCEICFFDNIKLPCHNHSDKVTYSSSYSIEGFIVFLKICKFELIFFVISKNACWLEFLRKRGELCTKFFVRIDFWVGRSLHRYPIR